MKSTFNCYVYGLFYIIPFVQGSFWSAWGPCSKTCSGGIQTRTLNCSSIEQTSDEWKDCANNKDIQTRNCVNRPCSDFALKCYHCHGSEVFCHQNKLKRNHTYDACNKHHNRCITKRFELDAGVKEVTMGCGREKECKIVTDKCNKKAFTHNKCDVSCCEEDYCNSGSKLRGLFGDSLTVLCSILLPKLTIYFL